MICENLEIDLPKLVRGAEKLMRVFPPEGVIFPEPVDLLLVLVREVVGDYELELSDRQRKHIHLLLYFIFYKNPDLMERNFNHERKENEEIH